jgi:hypothetical protein
MVEKCIHHDASEPGQKGRTSVELLYCQESFQEYFLRKIFRIVMVAAEPKRHQVHTTLMM